MSGFTFIKSGHLWRGAAPTIAAVALAGMALTQRQARAVEGRADARQESAVRAESERTSVQRALEAERRRTAGERDVLARRIEELSTEQRALRAQLDAVAQGDLQPLRDALLSTHERVATLEAGKAAGERIIRSYGGGVCLIQGSYAFYSEDGTPLRAKHPPAEGEDDARTEASTSGEDGEAENTGTDATAPIYTVDYYGTGFLVDASGVVLTNRHIAEPWWTDETAEQMKKQGYEARLVQLRAFFPNQPQPFDLRPERVADGGVDLAAVRVDLRGQPIPVLPLAEGAKPAVPGRPVVVLGYPTGLEALLAKAETSLVKQILDSHGGSNDRVTEDLSTRGMIRPSATQGHIGDVTQTDIVFDALTSQGGSGGPLFDESGRVVAVEYAVLPKFGGNSFAIPVERAVELLRPLRTRVSHAD